MHLPPTTTDRHSISSTVCIWTSVPFLTTMLLAVFIFTLVLVHEATAFTCMLLSKPQSEISVKCPNPPGATVCASGVDSNERRQLYSNPGDSCIYWRLLQGYPYDGRMHGCALLHNHPICWCGEDLEGGCNTAQRIERLYKNWMKKKKRHFPRRNENWVVTPPSHSEKCSTLSCSVCGGWQSWSLCFDSTFQWKFYTRWCINLIHSLWSSDFWILLC